MCYRCEVCNRKVGARLPRLVHTVYRTVPRMGGGTRQEIAKEYSICGKCKEALGLGLPFVTLLRQHGRPIRFVRSTTASIRSTNNRPR